MRPDASFVIEMLPVVLAAYRGARAMEKLTVALGEKIAEARAEIRRNGWIIDVNYFCRLAITTLAGGRRLVDGAARRQCATPGSPV